MTRRAVMRFLILLLIAAVTVPGCGGAYVLTGRVVEDAFPDVLFVPANDPALREKGVPGATITIVRDPQRPNRTVIATGRSDASGDVSITVDAFGAGWMQEMWLIQVVQSEHETFETLVELPEAGLDRRMLVILRRGRSRPAETPEDLYEEADRFR